MKNIVVLGAGTGGALIANMLTRKLDAREWAITIIDRAHRHWYQPGLLFIPFRLYGYEREDDVVRGIQDPLPGEVKFVNTEIKLIDHETKKVETEDGTFPYDWLVSAMGCRVAPEEVEGMEEAMNNGAHTFYTGDGAFRMQQALQDMKEGRLVIDIADMPIKCPVAPIEFAFLADYYFHLKNVRDRIDITLVTPYDGAFTKPNASRVLSQIAAEKNIKIEPNFALESVDAGARQLHSYEGKSLEYDLLCAIPPNLGPEVIEESGLGDGTGYGLTDPRTLKSRKAEYVYFIGDNSNVSASKAGSVAHFEAETVVENLLREIDGKNPLPSFDGHANCFIESGHHKALLIDFNYDMEPLEGSFPLPHVGPFSLLKESYINHVGKIAFKWVYWNMLLPGHLPKVPLLPSHMNFMGKDVSTAPAVRHSKAMQVKDVMKTEVVTIRQGSALSEAAKLMAEHSISGLPVLDVDDRVIGVLTEADFVSALDITGASFVQDMIESVVRKRRARKTMGTIVDDIMTRDPVTIREDETLQKAVELMDRNKVKRLPVTNDQGRLAGVLSRADLIRLFTMK